VFAKFLLRFLDYPTVLIRTLKCGFLVEVESLLSTFSTEDDMISDNLHAAGSLGHVVIRIEQASSSPEETEAKEAGPINQEFMLNQIKVTVETRDRKLTKQEQQQAAVAAAAAKKKRTIKREFIEFNEQNHVLVIVLHVPSVVYRRLPVDLKKTSVGYNSRTKPPKFISIVPIVISQGVNEMQSAANMLQYVTGGNENNDRQTNINIASMLTLVKYFQVYETYLRTHKPPVTASVADSKLHTHDVRLLSQVKDDMKLLNDLIDSSTGHKQVQILCKARCIVRRLRGGRVVMCKSAKDRTSMSVTWENAHTLTHHYDVSDNIVTDRSLLGGMQLMRAEGVRRANAFKNTGKKYYCFNSIQRRLLPGVLRPVDSVCGNVQS
jgi:hypothetical protein